MVDDTPPTNGSEPAAEPAAGEDTNPRIVIVTQYVKDLSFENPRAPVSLIEGEGQPHGDVAIQVRSRNLGNDNFEILLEFNIEAKRQGEVSFVAELVYGGVFTVSGFNDEMLEMATLVECPRILFPFARRIIADSVRDGGYAPLLLSPIDFLKLYQDRNKAQAASQQAEA